MARNKSRRRESSEIANRRLPVSYKPSYVHGPVTSLGFRPLRVFEDRRTWHPDRTRPAASFSTPRHRLAVDGQLGARLGRRQTAIKRASGLAMGSFPSSRVAFQSPSRVLICVRRAQRREVLFAKGIGGGGAPYNYRPRWTEFSNVRCK